VCIIGGERGGNKLSKEKNKDSKYIPNISPIDKYPEYRISPYLSYKPE
jgi:hypothetical protein